GGEVSAKGRCGITVHFGGGAWFVAALSILRLQLSESLTQGAFLLPTIRLVANDRGDSLDFVGGRMEQRNRKGNGQPSSIFMYRRNPQQVRAVSRLTGSHYVPVPFPMPDAQTFLNNQIARVPERLSVALSVQ